LTLDNHADIRPGYPSPGNYSKPVKQAIKELSIDHMKEFLGKFSG
jgi:hypothetical protein